MVETLEQKRAKKYIFYDTDNVRFEIKRFVLLFNDFVKYYERFPNPDIDEEKKLFNQWKKFINPKNLNAEEKQYIDKNLIKVEKTYIGKIITEKSREDISKPNNSVRAVIKRFVELYNNFLLTNNRKPSYDKKGEVSLYKQWSKYTNPENLSIQEYIYVKQNLKVADIRPAVKQFVYEFNKFVLDNKKVPCCNTKINEEISLYRKWIHYRNPKNLNEDEFKYVENNLAILYVQIRKKKEGNVRLSVKVFVEDFNTFVKEHNRRPSASFNNTKEERALYARWLHYLKPKNTNDDEKKYLEENLLQTQPVRAYVIKFVEDYNNFVRLYKRRPQQGRSLEENALCQRFNIFKKSKALNEVEKEYIKNNLDKIVEVRNFVIKFVNDYNQFIETYHRKPSSSPKMSKEERNLAKRLYNIKHLRQLTEQEIEHLKENLKNVESIEEESTSQTSQEF